MEIADSGREGTLRPRSRETSSETHARSPSLQVPAEAEEEGREGVGTFVVGVGIDGLRQIGKFFCRQVLHRFEFSGVVLSLVERSGANVINIFAAVCYDFS